MIKNHLIILAWIKNLQLWQNGMYFKQGLYFYREKNGGKLFETENLKNFPLLIMLYTMLPFWQIPHKMHEDKMSTTKVHKYLEKRLYSFSFLDLFVLVFRCPGSLLLPAGVL